MVGPPDVRRGALQVAFAGCQVSPSPLDASIYPVFPSAASLAQGRALVDFSRAASSSAHWEFAREAAAAEWQ
jgi:hypothetical protein